MSNSRLTMPDLVLVCVIPFIHDSRDRAAVSQVCHSWYKIDGDERKNITIPFCYSTMPDSLLKQFPNIESLKVKGKPLSAMFNSIQEEWGGYAGPWVDVLHQFGNLKSIEFRRMIVTDVDLQILAEAKGARLHCVKLYNCSRFSTDGLIHI